MKINFFTLIIALVFNACSNNKIAELPRRVSTLKSDILLQNDTIKPFSKPDQNDLLYLTLSGKTILESRATFKVLNLKGEELYCETFPAKALIAPAYKTANSTLQEAHLRTVVHSFFTKTVNVENVKATDIASL